MPPEKVSRPGKRRFVHTSTLTGQFGIGNAEVVKLVRASSINSGILIRKVSYLSHSTSSNRLRMPSIMDSISFVKVSAMLVSPSGNLAVKSPMFSSGIATSVEGIVTKLLSASKKHSSGLSDMSQPKSKSTDGIAS